MMHGTYIGPNPLYRGQTALIMPGVGKKKVMVQFDDMKRFFKLAHSWSQFQSKHWDVQTENVLI